MSKAPLLSFENVCASYGAIQALHDVCLHIYENEIVTLLGANGAGKTSLLMSLYHQPKIASGKILFQGNPIHHRQTHEISSLGIAIAPERRRIFVKMSTYENLLMGAYLLNKNQIAQNLEKVYALFPILKERQHQRAGTLSGGEQQMLSMGRSLMSSPKLFLLDEPSLGLAPLVVVQLFKVLKEISKMGTTILLVEQNAHLALKLAHRAYVLVNGKIELEGPSHELIANPKVQSAYLGKDH
ncbi:MAG: ABC transporter ATP-binding protein [Proteobacteria bacterium]|nr:ABC transporter ATP-binding protein [Pseudomonadota bacterium]